MSRLDLPTRLETRNYGVQGFNRNGVVAKAIACGSSGAGRMVATAMLMGGEMYWNSVSPDKDRPVPSVRLASALMAGAFVLTVAPAAAQDLSETRLFPENPFWEANTDGWPYLYGQINKGFLVHSDGDDTNFYPLVDNNNSSTRAGIKYEEYWWPGTTVFANVEGEWKPYSTSDVNQLNKDDVEWDTYDLRKFEVRFDVQDYGRLWLGQGSTASDGTVEKDLSGTSVVGYSSVADSAAGQFFALGGGQGLSNVRIGDAFANLDGLSRRMRARYDTPEFFGGARLSSSVGYNALSGDDDVGWDVAATFERNEPGEALAMSAGLSFVHFGDGNRTGYGGSASILHKPSGISVTVAEGLQDRKGSPRDPLFFYGKLGYRPDLTDLGPTALSVDLFWGEDFRTINSESISIGLAGVQTIEYKDTSFDIYGTVRHYSFDESSVDYENGLSFLTGVRWSF